MQRDRETKAAKAKKASYLDATGFRDKYPNLSFLRETTSDPLNLS